MGAAESLPADSTESLKLLSLLADHALKQDEILRHAKARFNETYLTKNLEPWQREMESEFIELSTRHLSWLAETAAGLAKDIGQTKPQRTVQVVVTHKNGERVHEDEWFSRLSGEDLLRDISQWVEASGFVRRDEEVKVTQLPSGMFSAVIHPLEPTRGFLRFKNALNGETKVVEVLTDSNGDMKGVDVIEAAKNAFEADVVRVWNLGETVRPESLISKNDREDHAMRVVLG